MGLQDFLSSAISGSATAQPRGYRYMDAPATAEYVQYAFGHAQPNCPHCHDSADDTLCVATATPTKVGGGCMR